MVRVFQLARMPWHARHRQIARQAYTPSRRSATQRARAAVVLQLAAADHAVHVLADEVHLAVAHAQVQLDLGMARMEAGKAGTSTMRAKGWARPRAAGPGRGRGVGQAGLGIVHVGQQAQHAFVIGRAVGRDIDLASRAVQQPDAQPRLQLLHQLRHTGPADAQRLGRLGEAACLHHPRKRLHCIESVHACLPFARLFAFYKQCWTGLPVYRRRTAYSAASVHTSRPAGLYTEIRHDPTRRRLSPGRQALYERNRYSPAIKANGFLFVSGQVGSREDGSPEPDLDEQVRLAFRNLNAVLAAAGCSFDDVVDVTVFIVDPIDVRTDLAHRSRVLGTGAVSHADRRGRHLAVWVRR